MAADVQVSGKNAQAAFTLKAHRGEGMVLLAMNWKAATPPDDFVGFAIEYKEPGGARYFALQNRLGFAGANPQDASRLSTLRAPIQKFRWVHFPRNAELEGAFTYRVTPVFMNPQDQLSLGEPQTVDIELRRETYPGQLNVSFTRGFVSSQAFVDRYESVAPISTLLPAKAADGLRFTPTHPKAEQALPWMGFEARSAVLELLDQAVATANAKVMVVAYDLNLPEIVSRLEQLGPRLRIVIDDAQDHGDAGSAETQAAARLLASAGAANVKRQHMGQLQHNKMLVVDAPRLKAVVCGSTNFSWRGLYVQANNAMVLRGRNPVALFKAAFEGYWASDSAADFAATPSARWTPLGLDGIQANVTFSPHNASNAALQGVADDVARNTRSSLFYSLAFLYQTPGAMQDAIKAVTLQPGTFVYGMSDRKVGGLDFQKPDGKVSPLYPAALTGKAVPEPFKSEPTGGGGIRMHHKFLVVDFDKPSARVYLGSYNFSKPADGSNGENLLLIKNKRVAVAYMVEALRLFDHYHFRIAQQEATQARTVLALRKPPRQPGETPWWREHYQDERKVRDRLLFA